MRKGAPARACARRSGSAAPWLRVASGWAPLAVLVLAACSGHSGGSSAFAPFENATVTAGKGFADMPLGSTLSAVASRLGDPDQVAAVAGDEYFAELIYEGAGVTLQFNILPDCVKALQSQGRVATSLMRLRKTAAFLGDFPACQGSPLQSMALGMGQKPGNAYYKGATENGVRIGSPKEQVLRAYGGSHDVRGVSLAGSSPDDSNYDELIYANGLALYLGPAGGEGSWQVHRIVVFALPQE